MKLERLLLGLLLVLSISARKIKDLCVLLSYKNKGNLLGHLFQDDMIRALDLTPQLSESGILIKTQ